MNKTEQNLADVNFIIEKINFFQSLTKTPGELKKHDSDASFFLNLPSRRGISIYGKEAHNRFHRMAERYLSTQKDKNDKVKGSDFTKELFSEFSTRFLEKQNIVNEKNVSLMLAKAYKTIERSFDSITHVIPCSVVRHENPSSFTMGPVQFFRTEKYIENNNSNFSLERERISQSHKERCKLAIKEGYPASKVATPRQSDEYANYLVDNSLSYLKNYDWVAEVTVNNCHHEVSKMRAKMAVEGALNILKLIIGEFHSDKMRLGNSATPPIKTASVIKNSKGHFNFSLRQDSDSNFVCDDWFEKITENYKHELNSLNMGLQTITEPDKSNFLSQRIFDSLKWYGEAVSELSPSTKLLKYIASIERIVGTEEKKKGLS